MHSTSSPRGVCAFKVVVHGIVGVVPELEAFFGRVQPDRRANLREFFVRERRVVLARRHARNVLDRLEYTVPVRDLDAHAGSQNDTAARTRPGHHANAWFARCAQGPSMPEGRAERAVEANATSIDAPRAQPHAERRDG